MNEALLGLIGLLVGVGIGFVLYKQAASRSAVSAQARARDRLSEAEEEAEGIRREALVAAKEEAARIRQEAELQVKERSIDVQRKEARIIQKEEMLDISWVDWNHGDREERLIAFVRKLIGLRSRYPVLRRARWLTGEYNEELEVKDVTWINADGTEMQEAHWKDGNVRCFGMLLDGRAQETGIRRRGELATLLIIFNPWQDVVNFKLPAATGGKGWTLRADTNFPDATEEPEFEIGHVYAVTARSLLLFQLT